MFCVFCDLCIFLFFFFNDTATTEINTYCHTLSLHDALPISGSCRVQSPLRVTTPASAKASCVASVSMATRSLTLQTRHQSAVKSTKTGVPAASSSASRAVLNVSWRSPSATSPEAVAALGASGTPTVRTAASASAAGASVSHPAEPRRWRRPYHHRDTAKSERTSRPKPFRLRRSGDREARRAPVRSRTSATRALYAAYPSTRRAWAVAAGPQE